MKKNVLDFNDLFAGLLDQVCEFFGKGVSLQLVSTVHYDLENEVKGGIAKICKVQEPEV
ncbi:Linoleate 9S-lipoxygenase [Bertholletia excelsa]